MILFIACKVFLTSGETSGDRSGAVPTKNRLSGASVHSARSCLQAAARRTLAVSLEPFSLGGAKCSRFPVKVQWFKPGVFHPGGGHASLS